jgi:hypothetical protein
MHLATAEQFAAALDRYVSIADALTIHRQHLDAARRAIATNDNDNHTVRELLGELLGEPRSARRGEGVGDAPVSSPGVGLGEDSPPPLSARRPSS